MNRWRLAEVRTGGKFHSNNKLKRMEIHMNPLKDLSLPNYAAVAISDRLGLLDPSREQIEILEYTLLIGTYPQQVNPEIIRKCVGNNNLAYYFLFTKINEWCQLLKSDLDEEFLIDFENKRLESDEVRLADMQIGMNPLKELSLPNYTALVILTHLGLSDPNPEQIKIMNAAVLIGTYPQQLDPEDIRNCVGNDNLAYYFLFIKINEWCQLLKYNLDEEYPTHFENQLNEEKEEVEID